MFMTPAPLAEGRADLVKKISPACFSEDDCFYFRSSPNVS
jgi:hypothetical protein